MTVKELIQELSKFDSNMKVAFSHITPDSPDIEIKDVSVGRNEKDTESYVYLWDE